MAEIQFTMVRDGRHATGSVPLLHIDHLTVKVGIRRVIQDLSLDVFEGDAICVSGANGSGKSTLLNAIAGLAPAMIEEGTISLGGRDLTELPAHERSRCGLAFLRQRENVFIDLTVDENLRLAVGPDGPDRFRESHPTWASDLPGRRQVGLLSGGQKQRLAWALATLRPSRLLMADEPEAALSSRPPIPTSGTFLFVSHDLASWMNA